MLVGKYSILIKCVAYAFLAFLRSWHCDHHTNSGPSCHHPLKAGTQTLFNQKILPQKSFQTQITKDPSIGSRNLTKDILRHSFQSLTDNDDDGQTIIPQTRYSRMDLIECLTDWNPLNGKLEEERPVRYLNSVIFRSECFEPKGLRSYLNFIMITEIKINTLYWMFE